MDISQLGPEDLLHAESARKTGNVALQTVAIPVGRGKQEHEIFVYEAAQGLQRPRCRSWWGDGVCFAGDEVEEGIRFGGELEERWEACGEVNS